MQKILIIAHKSQWRPVQGVLKEAGFVVATHPGTQAALAIIEAEKPDLIITDPLTELGATAGLDLLQDIRSQYYNLPVILYSTYDQFKQDLRSIAADYCVIKSDDFSELLYKVNLALEVVSSSDPLFESSLNKDDLVDLKTKEPKHDIVIVSQFINAMLMSELEKHPEKMLSLTPRQFEEFVAELFVREGYNVELTPERKDGGRDIIAVSSGQLGSHLYLAECKRYNPKRPVGVEYVRALYGVLEEEKATRGILATTSYFTKGATELAGKLKWRMGLKNYGDLKTWLRKHVASQKSDPSTQK